MKQLLTLFVLLCMCSFIFNTELELKNQNTALISSSNTLLSELYHSKKSKPSHLYSGESIYSRNGKFVLTMQESTCRLVLKNTEGKVLFQSFEVGKQTGCIAILRRNSNFEILSKKRTVIWSTKTSKNKGTNGPFRLTINEEGNVIVRNRKRECVWALFGCPISKVFQNKIKRMKPRKAANILNKKMTGLKRKLNALPLTALPRARGKPEIKNQLPKNLSKKKPADPKPKSSLKTETVEKLKDLINDGPVTGDQWFKFRRLVGKSVPRHQLRKLKELVKTGNFSYSDIKKKAMEKVKKAKNQEPVKINKKVVSPTNVKTKTQLQNAIKTQVWFTTVKKLIRSNANIKEVKKVLIEQANVKGNTSFWRNIANAVKTKNVDKVVRQVSLPVRTRFVWRAPVYYPPRKRWILRYRSYITWYWAYRSWGGYWRYYCRRWWWWRRCWWSWSSRGGYWYRYYYWTGYRYWSYE